MDRNNIIEQIIETENSDTIIIIGKIDFEVLQTKQSESLYYSYPLIERLVFEIYNLIPEANIEQYEQGVMRTIVSILNLNSQIDVIPENLKMKIKGHFGSKDDDKVAPRNELFHPNGEIRNILIDFNEVNTIILDLLRILKENISKYNNYILQDIGLVEN